jgi:FKBP-type peptidyl-prolyl cis-trans isomerase FkpA
MTYIKYALLICLAGFLAACGKDNKGTFDAEAQFKADTTAIRAFVIKNNIPVLKTSNGVFYQIIAPGTGSTTYTASTKVTADYTGKLLNGTIFDTTAGKSPIQFSLGGVIAGWQIGIPLIQNGGTIRLLIPSYFAYGNSSPNSLIPANSILDFTVTLTNVQ